MKQKLLFTGLMALMLVMTSMRGWGQAAPGDIAFIAFNADGGDDFAFVTFVDIPAFTSIYFTDNEWNGTAFVDLNEGELNWTNGASTLVAGSIVVITDPQSSGTANVGTISGSGWNLGGSDEWFYALLSAPATSYVTPPVFLSAMANDAGANWLSGTGLVEGTTALDFNDDNDGSKYTGSRTNQSSFPLYLPIIMNSSNWQIESSDGELILPISTSSFSLSTTNPAATPTFDPAAGTYYTSQNVTISCETAGSTIYYTTDGSAPDNTSTEYTGAIAVSSTTTLKAIAYATDYDPSSIATAVYTFPIEVADISTLRSGAQDGTLYKLTGEAILTFQTASRNAKYIQDATGAILIDDNSGIITTSYDIYDGITGISGTLSAFQNMLQFIPTVDPGSATSTGNTVTPVEVTLANLDNSYQAKLVKVLDASITGSGDFVAATNYDLTDPSGSGLLRTAYSDLNYIGTPISGIPQDITGVVLQYSTNMQLVPRSLSDFTSPITFNVDMSSAGSFTTVEVLGDFQDPIWSGNTMSLVSDNIYTFTTDAIFSDGDAIEFKFRTDGSNWEGGDNRTYTVVPGSNVYNAVWNVMNPAVINWANLQYPASGSIYTGDDYNVYAQIYADGITYTPGATPNLSAWVGFNDIDNDPSTWTNWVEASFNTQSGNNDEFVANLGTSLPAGTYYYATRFKLGLGDFVYGGYSESGGNFWDGTSNISGVITVEDYVITTFPYSQSFDGEHFAPIGWTNERTAGTSDPGIWDRQTTGQNPSCSPHSGAAMARFFCYSYDNGTKAELRTPAITFPSDEYLVSFWMYRDDPGWGPLEDLVNVYFNTTNSAVGGTLLGTIHRQMDLEPVVLSEGWYQYSFLMPSGAAGSGKYLIFEGVSANANNIFIDDVSIEAYPSTTWTGTIDNDWATAGNWNNGVPGSITNVTIPAGLTNYPTISSAATCFNITLQSSASGTASLLGNGSLTVNGSSTIQRYVTGGNNAGGGTSNFKYHLLSIPLAADIQAGDVFSNTYLWQFVPNQTAENSWANITSLTETLDNQKGFLSYVPDAGYTFSFTGDMNSGSFSVATETVDVGNVKLIPNPYPSAIDWESVDLTGTGLNPTIWFFNSATGNYESYNGGVGDGQQYIPVGQAVFVEAQTANPTLTFTDAYRTHNQGSGFYKSRQENHPDVLRVAVSANNSADATYIRFRAAADDHYFGFDDAYKLRGFSGSPQLYTQSADGVNLSINTMATSQETVILPLAYELEVDGSAQLSFEYLESFDASVEIYLEDLMTNQMINLRETASYQFNHTAGNTPDRFRLHFMGVTATPEIGQAADRLKVWTAGDQLYIHTSQPQGESLQIDLFDANGRLLQSLNKANESPVVISSRTMQGLILVRVTGNNDVQTQKVFIR